MNMDHMMRATSQQTGDRRQETGEDLSARVPSCRLLTPDSCVLMLILLGVVSLASTAAAQTEQISRTVPLAAGGEVVVSNVTGDIVVEGTDGRQVQIEATKRVRRGSADQLDAVQVEIVERGGRVDVRTEYPRSRRSVSVAVDYRLTVPRDARVSLHSVSGNVTLSNVQGESRAETVSGDVSIASVTQLVRVKTVSGDIQLRDAATDRELSAETVSGDLDASGLNVQRLDLGTVSGDITLDTARSSQATIRTVSGDVDYIGSLVRNGRYEMQSHSGDVRLTLDREQLWLVHTPQVFRRDWFAQALAQACLSPSGDGRQASHALGQFPDDAAILEAAGFLVRMVPGDPLNLKVTTSDDMMVAEAILRSRRR